MKGDKKNMKRLIILCLLVCLALLFLPSCGSETSFNEPDLLEKSGTVNDASEFDSLSESESVTQAKPNPRPPSSDDSNTNESGDSLSDDPSLHTADVDNIMASGWISGWH